MTSIRPTLAALLLITSAGVVAAPAKDIKTEEKGAGYSFSFSYPAFIGQFPALQKNIETQKTETLAELKDWAKEWVAENPDRASESDLESQVTWLSVANLPGYLSLTIDEWSYTGGAHGGWGRGSMIWDKKASVERKPVSLFTSAEAFDKVVQTPFCDLLDVERSAKRDGEKVDRSQTDDWMQACPKPSELTVILGSSDGKKFNRLAVYAGIYSVGPYVEGDYEIDLPVTPKLLAAVKPEYRGIFAVTPKAVAKRGKR